VTATAEPTASAGTSFVSGASTLAVRLAHISKSFKLPHERAQTLKERVLHPIQTRRYDVLKAVDDVSVEIAAGEFFGIVGRNGSGKSTLLKCLAGIYETEGGTLEVNGRLAPFIELGVGFNPELTARDNAIINAIMLGLTRKQAMERLDAIIEFAELEEFMNLKLKNFSSGMHVRLAFAVAVEVDADVLLIDEVLAVGDASFQQKCFDQFARLKAEGRTIIFVTHDMGAVEHFCDRAMLMEHGRVVSIGDSPTVTRRYNELNFRHVRREAVEQGGPEALRRPPVAELLSAAFRTASGEPLPAMQQGETCRIRLETRFHDAADDPIFAVAMRNDRGETAFATSTELRGIATGHFSAGETAVVEISFENWLAPGRYNLEASVTPDGLGANAYDLREAMSSMVVFATKSGGGSVDLPHTLELTRG
jgi:ABC-2 type transport system ATP-binding protein